MITDYCNNERQATWPEPPNGYVLNKTDRIQNNDLVYNWRNKEWVAAPEEMFGCWSSWFCMARQWPTA